MKKKRGTILGLLLCCVVFTLGACSKENMKEDSSKKAIASSKVASIEIENGTYILPEDGDVTENTGYLALDVKINNIGKDTLNLSLEEINLYDEDDNKISQKDIYTDDENFKKLQFESISGGKSTNGYVIFKVDKNKEYELHYTPNSYLDDKKEDIQIKVETKKYKDTSLDIQKIAESFVNDVFLNKKSENKDIANNIEEEKTSFNVMFSKALEKEFYYYKPSEAELMTNIDAFKNANAKKAKIDYSIKEFYPESATIYVKPETIHFDNLDTDSIISEFVDKNEGKYSDYEKAETDAEKYLLEQLPSKYETTSVSSNDSFSGEGYEIHFTKENGKWKVDTSDSSDNYSFKSLKKAFMGDINS
ncbi:DUF4352 domain-containing protein [Enterococcus sp. DIV0242_7C1]|uniref:DUF4352 domain-containing protein n=2 Tax=Candidatus Enterococcus dunnyi TaxID=1834192 RepID=A0AAQ3Y2E8_9ENTE|nr:DUF4352 domain-containing protein [Enterococcus sp. DIV0242_7C1]MBO0469916.1 DUF4352 domain-containing protein [Enterococcus sp. DIV0242_7C1]